MTNFLGRSKIKWLKEKDILYKMDASKVSKVSKDECKTKLRNACFTLNNYTEEEYFNIIEKLNYNYLVIGKEQGNEKETPHLQGYIEFKQQMRFGTLKNFNNRIHWEKRYGTAQQAAEYCKKENEYAEYGELSRQGKRSDLENVIDNVDNGLSIMEIAEQNPIEFIKYSKGITAYQLTKYKQRKEAPKVFWLWGKSGTGKTYTAIKAHDSFYMKDAGTVWWDGYTQQTAIIIDDFDGKWNFKDFLRLLQEAPYRGQTKGGHIEINSPYIYITCEWPPYHFWKRENDLIQIVRRCEEIRELTYERPPDEKLKRAMAYAKKYKNIYVDASKDINALDDVINVFDEVEDTAPFITASKVSASQVVGNTILPLNDRKEEFTEGSAVLTKRGRGRPRKGKEEKKEKKELSKGWKITDYYK